MMMMTRSSIEKVSSERSSYLNLAAVETGI